MPLSGDIRINQDGVVPSVRDLTNANPFDVAMVDANGDQIVGFDSSRPDTSALTSVTVATVSISLLASNPLRRQFLLFNDGTNNVFVAFAAVASTTAFTVRIPANGFYESVPDGYTGDVFAIRSAGSGAVKVTEITT